VCGMNKATSLSLSIVLLFSVAMATSPFYARFNVTWDSIGLQWLINNKSVGDELSVASGEIGLFNVTSGTSDFFISSVDCSSGTTNALSRKDGVTNNACTPPCTVAYKLQPGYYSYCSTLKAVTTSGTLHALECKKLQAFRCAKVIGCGWNNDTSKCGSCFEATKRKDCEKMSNCTWCDNEGVCLHEKSGACRALVVRERAVASWVWLLITLIAIFVLFAVFATLFLAELGFKKRWAEMSKADKDFAEVGKGANDGLFATD